MTVLFDATALLLLLNENTAGPKYPGKDEFIPDAHERMEYAVNKIRQSGEQIVIAAPVLAELLVRGENAASPYIEIFNKSPHFRPVPFDQKAAVTHAEYTRRAIVAGEEMTESKCKVKFDRQIVAIAKAEGVHTIYTDDERLAKHAKAQGINIVLTHEIVMDKQPNLFAEVEANGKAKEVTVSDENTKGETVVETVPPPLMPDPLIG